MSLNNKKPQEGNDIQLEAFIHFLFKPEREPIITSVSLLRQSEK